MKLMQRTVIKSAIRREQDQPPFPGDDRRTRLGQEVAPGGLRWVQTKSKEGQFDIEGDGAGNDEGQE